MSTLAMCPGTKARILIVLNAKNFSSRDVAIVFFRITSRTATANTADIKFLECGANEKEREEGKMEAEGLTWRKEEDDGRQGAAGNFSLPGLQE